MLEKSILKNFYNYYNNKIGEIFRLCDNKTFNKKEYNIIFIDIIPNETYICNRLKKTFKLEKVYERFHNTISIKEHKFFKDKNYF